MRRLSKDSSAKQLKQVTGFNYEHCSAQILQPRLYLLIDSVAVQLILLDQSGSRT